MEFPVTSVQRKQFAVRHRTGADNDLIIWRRSAEKLDPLVELVAPKKRNRCIRLGVLTTRTTSNGEEVAGRERTLFGRIGPVLDTHLLVEQRVRPTGHVACGIDTWGCTERLIAHDAIA